MSRFNGTHSAPASINIFIFEGDDIGLWSFNNVFMK